MIRPWRVEWRVAWRVIRFLNCKKNFNKKSIIRVITYAGILKTKEYVYIYNIHVCVCV
jgi:hypothetical protein